MIRWFVFSSRRRHTRWTGDWSSDVCSSDLAEALKRLHIILMLSEVVHSAVYGCSERAQVGNGLRQPERRARHDAGHRPRVSANERARASDGITRNAQPAR